MTKSATGTVEKPGKNVKTKSGLNKAILDQGRQISYKATWRGGKVILVPPQYTSQTCSQCGHVDKGPTQARFQCTSCGHTMNADLNAAIHIWRQGMSSEPSGNSLWSGHKPTVKQEPSHEVKHDSVGSPRL